MRPWATATCCTSGRGTSAPTAPARRSTPDKPFSLRTVGTWDVNGQEGSRADTEGCLAALLLRARQHPGAVVLLPGLPLPRRTRRRPPLTHWTAQDGCSCRPKCLLSAAPDRAPIERRPTGAAAISRTRAAGRDLLITTAVRPQCQDWPPTMATHGNGQATLHSKPSNE